MKYTMSLIATSAKDNSETEIKTDVNCSIRLVNGRILRAIAKLEYMGITINDIRVTERRGELKIDYPKNTFVSKDGKEKSSSIVFPNMRELGNKFNHIIQQEYSMVAYAQSKNPALRVLASSISNNEDADAVSMAA